MLLNGIDLSHVIPLVAVLTVSIISDPSAKSRQKVHEDLSGPVLTEAGGHQDSR